MIENNQMHNETLTDQSKTISLFQFIRELNKLKQKAILNTKDYPCSAIRRQKKSSLLTVCFVMQTIPRYIIPS